MSIESYTGCSVYNTIKNKFTIKEKRHITVHTLLVLNVNEIRNYRIKLIYDILNNKATLINNIYRNYKIRKYIKLNNSYKRLILHLPFNDTKYICNDIIEKIFNSLIINK